MPIRWLLLLVVLGAEAREAEPVVDGTVTINTQQAARLHELGAVFIDVRPARQWGWGHIRGAVHLDLHGAFARLARSGWPRQVPLVVYCDSELCPRSALAARRLVEWGYTAVYYYREGFFAWQLQDMPQGRGMLGEQVAFSALNGAAFVSGK